jgi:hypothetical protein
MSQRRGPPNLPPEEPAIPLDPSVAKARATYIKDQANKILSLKEEGKSEFEIREIHERFSKDYPQLFKMLMSGVGFNDPSLRTMLSMLEKMGTGELSQHQASVIVGQRLHDKYIKPSLDSSDATK